jgi:endonuclease-3
LITKLHKALKKRYNPALPRGEQPVFDALLMACCLENTPRPVAEEALENLRGAFFDWNEVRVTTIKELSEVLGKVADPAKAATQLKGVLQSIYESEYCFELDSIKKKNLGEAIKRLQKLEGASPFVVAYATQVALGGHAIPVDGGALRALHIVGVISDAEFVAHEVPGLDRAIPKNKGIEFGALLHELGAELVASPFAPPLRDFFLDIAPDAKERLPKRGSKKTVAEPPPQPVAKPSKKTAAPVATERAKPAKRAAKAKDGAPPAKKTARAAKTSSASGKKKAAATKKTGAKTLAKRKPR